MNDEQLFQKINELRTNLENIKYSIFGYYPESRADDEFAKVGLFWYDDDKKEWITDMVDLSKVKNDIGYDNYRNQHRVVWSRRDKNYKYYPRGRVNYQSLGIGIRGIFHISLDPCLNNTKCIEKIKELFWINKSPTVLDNSKTKTHSSSRYYQCHNCVNVKK